MFQITSNLVDDKLVFNFIGKLDTNSYQDADKIIEETCKNTSFSSIVIDAEKLEYISSSGIRTILKAKKKYDDVSIINTSSEIYEIFELTGLTEIMDIKKAFRNLSVDGCKVIGEGAKGIVYRYSDDIIVKVYKNSDVLDSIDKERTLARRAFILGVPTSISYDIVKVGDLYGSVFEMIDAKTISELISENTDDYKKYAEITAKLLRLIHSIEVKTDEIPNAKTTVNKWVDACIPFFTDEENKKIRRLVDDTSNDMNLLHFDFHTNNIMIQDEEPMLIDMDTLCHGNPIFELANVYVAYVGFGIVDKTIVENFIHFPYELSLKFWDEFLLNYLDDKSDKAEEIEKKIKLLAYMRIIRHISRRGINSETDKLAVEHCVCEVKSLLNEVDNLNL